MCRKVQFGFLRGYQKKAPRIFEALFVLSMAANRLVKSEINQAFMADFDCFHGVETEGLVLLYEVEFHT